MNSDNQLDTGKRVINLLDRSLFAEELPWGASPTGRIFNYQAEEVLWSASQVGFGVSKKSNTARFRGEGSWEWQYRQREYQAGLIVSKNRYHFGTYECTCRLPDFRGSWPAFWLIDVVDVASGGQGIPPETDVFEHFRKDGFSTRFRVTSTFHFGSSYSGENKRVEARTACFPWDRTFHTFRLKWNKDLLLTSVDDKEILRIENDPWIPRQPMNVLLSSGVGDWGPDSVKFTPFVVTALKYIPE